MCPVVENGIALRMAIGEGSAVPRYQRMLIKKTVRVAEPSNAVFS